MRAHKYGQERPSYAPCRTIPCIVIRTPITPQSRSARRCNRPLLSPTYFSLKSLKRVKLELYIPPPTTPFLPLDQYLYHPTEPRNSTPKQSCVRLARKTISSQHKTMLKNPTFTLPRPRNNAPNQTRVRTTRKSFRKQHINMPLTIQN